MLMHYSWTPAIEFIKTITVEMSYCIENLMLNVMKLHKCILYEENTTNNANEFKICTQNEK